jgi:glutamine amidotransferase-like uncharacterized protein
MAKYSFLPMCALVALSLSACNSPGAAGTDGSSLSTTPGAGGSPAQSSTPPSGAPARNYKTDVLLFTGSGTWGTEVTNLENILTSNGASYQSVSSAQLDAMSVDDIAQFGVMVFPGGAGGTEAGGLSAQTHANLRAAVQQRGVSYVGFCAGSFIAQAPAPAAGQDVSYGLGVVAGPVLDYYYLENQGTDIAMTLESFPDGSTADILWYGGPVTPNVAGGVIAKYPDGNPAMTQLWSGNGLVILSGPHPTANQATLSALGMTSTDGIHQDIAWKLINAALHQQPMPAF